MRFFRQTQNTPLCANIRDDAMLVCAVIQLSELHEWVMCGSATKAPRPHSKRIINFVCKHPADIIFEAVVES